MERLIYLDNGATTFPKPEEVYRAIDFTYRNYGVNPGRSGYDLCIAAGEVVENTRKLLTRFFNGTDPNRLTFAYNATDALNLAIWGTLQPGDHAITTALEHNSVLRPLYHLWRDHGVEVDHLPFDAKGFVSPDEFKRHFKKNTKLVTVNHGSNVIGTVQDIAAIGKLCRERDVTILVDVSQTAGKIPIDMQAMNLDIVAFTGHKSLMGPMGIGGLYVGEGAEVRHTRAGGTGVRSALRPHLDEYPYRLEYGTPNLLGIAGLQAGVKWLEEQGLANIERTEAKMLKRLRDGIREIEGVILYCQDDLTDHIGVLSFNIEGTEAAEVGTMLDVDYSIACRTGLHCAPMVHEQLGTDKIHGSVRLGIGPFTSESDIDAAIAAVSEIAQVRRPVTADGRRHS
ncbi:MAG: aminotransferase class V-fold PLP-dependent enzyme [candidate division Zixibacteria bacterium]|nr:aminotransferase class V-fold PLP-dependent enzyme [candidate division Zixibacteria bacterium]